MSTKGISTVIFLAMSDAQFANALMTDPDQILEGFDVSTEEKALFHGVTESDLRTMAGMAPEERRSFFVIIGSNEEEKHGAGR